MIASRVEGASAVLGPDSAPGPSLDQAAACARRFFAAAQGGPGGRGSGRADTGLSPGAHGLLGETDAGRAAGAGDCQRARCASQTLPCAGELQASVAPVLKDEKLIVGLEGENVPEGGGGRALHKRPGR